MLIGTKIDALKNRLKKGETVLGGWVQLRDAAIGSIFSRSGFDWVTFDLEHGTGGLDNVREFCESVLLAGSIPFVRITKNCGIEARLCLDRGACGIIIPSVEDPEKFKETVEMACFGPGGRRGLGFFSANGFGSDLENYVKNVEKPLIFGIIESVHAVNHLQKILATDGVTGYFVGPYDLSNSLGIPGQFAHPRFVETLKKIRDEVKAENQILGIHVVQDGRLGVKSAIEEGYQFIACGTDTLFLRESAAEILGLDGTV